MLNSANQLRRFNIAAVDGRIGRIKDIYFDDEHWTVRYLVIDTEEWLVRRTVLSNPAAVHNVDRGAGEISLQLTKVQVRDSPDVDTEKPISRQQEAAHAEYYGNAYYWMRPSMSALHRAPPGPVGVIGRAPEASTNEVTSDHHLRSTLEVTGYRIDATDGKLGRVDDFLLDEDTWMVCFLVVDTRVWIPGKHVLVAPDWVERVSWNERTVDVALNQRTIRNSPEFTDISALTGHDEDALYAYYASASSPNRQLQGPLRAAKTTRPTR